MAGHSISEEVLARFAAGSSTLEERKSVVRHLLSGCTTCREYLARQWRQSRPQKNVVRLFDHSFDTAFDRSVRRVLALTVPSLSSVATILDRLDAQPLERQEMFVRNSRAYWRPEVCDAFVERSYEARFNDARRMLHQATLAVLTAENLPNDRALSYRAGDCRARAWAVFGNSLRVAGDLNAADRALKVAALHLRDGSGDTLLRAELLSQLSSLRFDQRDFAASFSMAEELTRIWRNHGDFRELCRALVKKAIAAGEGGAPQEALRILSQAEEILDSSADSQLLLLVRHNSVRFLLDTGRLDEGRDLYFTTAPLYETTSDPLVRLKGRWLTGQMLSAFGAREEAAEVLVSVRSAFLERGNEYEGAQAALYLADTLLGLGRIQEARALAREAFRVLRERHVGRDALASLILLQSASGG